MMNLQHGDCLELLPKLADNSVDLIVTDPPYGMTNNPWDKKIDLPRLWRELHRVGKENAAFVMFAAQPFATDLIQSNRRNFRYDLVWQKKMAVGFLNANRMPLRSHELILVFYRRLPDYFPQKTAGKPYRARIAARPPVTMEASMPARLLITATATRFPSGSTVSMRTNITPRRNPSPCWNA